jgi:hypothetical protein
MSIFGKSLIPRRGKRPHARDERLPTLGKAFLAMSGRSFQDFKASLCENGRPKSSSEGFFNVRRRLISSKRRPISSNGRLIVSKGRPISLMRRLFVLRKRLLLSRRRLIM